MLKILKALLLAVYYLTQIPESIAYLNRKMNSNGYFYILIIFIWYLYLIFNLMIIFIYINKNGPAEIIKGKGCVIML